MTPQNPRSYYVKAIKVFSTQVENWYHRIFLNGDERTGTWICTIHQMATDDPIIVDMYYPLSHSALKDVLEVIHDYRLRRATQVGETYKDDAEIRYDH